jgi:hypothetical protein
MPVNAVLDLALADGLNQAPLAGAGWRVTCLEVPVVTELGTVVCDVVLFNEAAGHPLVVEARSGANIEPEQARKLSAIDPQALILAGGITVPRAVPLRRETMFACLAENAGRIIQGLTAAELALPVLAVDESQTRLAASAPATSGLRAALGKPVAWRYPVASIIPFDHESPRPAAVRRACAVERGRRRAGR